MTLTAWLLAGLLVALLSPLVALAAFARSAWLAVSKRAALDSFTADPRQR